MRVGRGCEEGGKKSQRQLCITSGFPLMLGICGLSVYKPPAIVIIYCDVRRGHLFVIDLKSMVNESMAAVRSKVIH